MSPKLLPVFAVFAAAATLCGCASTPAPPRLADEATVLRARPIVQVVSSALSDAVDGRVYVAVIGNELRPGEQQFGVSYTVRRAADGALVEVAQPMGPAIASGTRVRIVQDPLVRLVPN